MLPTFFGGQRRKGTTAYAVLWYIRLVNSGTTKHVPWSRAKLESRETRSSSGGPGSAMASGLVAPACRCCHFPKAWITMHPIEIRQPGPHGFTRPNLPPKIKRCSLAQPRLQIHANPKTILEQEKRAGTPQIKTVCNPRHLISRERDPRTSLLKPPTPPLHPFLFQLIHSSTTFHHQHHQFHHRAPRHPSKQSSTINSARVINHYNGSH